MELEIIEPVKSKGLEKEHVVEPEKSEVPPDAHALYLGLVITGEDGKALHDEEVTITTTDKDQDVVLKTTGNVLKRFNKDGVKETIHYYPFNYKFKTSGKHTIKFQVGELSKEVEVDVKDNK